MNEQEISASDLFEEINLVVKKLGIENLNKEAQELRNLSETTDFWQKPSEAQLTMKHLSEIENKVGVWNKIQKNAQDLSELASLNDPNLTGELKKQILELENEFTILKKDLRFNGPYDDHNAILSIHAGAGGTDAQDWAEMLLRMYVRWADKNKLKVKTVLESSGEEAGLKSVTIEIDGTNIYGKLKGEHGVHRLVRLSPFNADSLRQTSFAKVEIMPKIDPKDALDIDEKDLKIDVYRAGGHGGQSVNTTDSAVRITHVPTGIVVNIQNERSQLQNKETAMTLLRSKLIQLQLEQHQERLEKIKGPNQSAEWGNQIRSYVLHPYKQVKDLRTKYETSSAEEVLDGDLNPFIDAFLEDAIKAIN